MKNALIISGLVLACLLFSATVAAQTTSNIEGTVKDPHGAVVSGADIKVTSQSLTLDRTTKSDENGFFRITALPAGTYTMTVSGSGFANSTIQNVELTVNRTITLEVQLEVGKVNEQINVS